MVFQLEMKLSWRKNDILRITRLVYYMDKVLPVLEKPKGEVR